MAKTFFFLSLNIMIFYLYLQFKFKTTGLLIYSYQLFHIGKFLITILKYLLLTLLQPFTDHTLGSMGKIQTLINHLGINQLTFSRSSCSRPVLLMFWISVTLAFSRTLYMEYCHYPIPHPPLTFLKYTHAQNSLTIKLQANKTKKL